MRVDALVEAGEGNDAAIALVEATRADVLLIPFHAHRSHTGELLDGLTLIQRIRAEVPIHATTPILCPISNVGVAAAGLMKSRLGGPFLQRVLLIYEDDLGRPSLPGEITKFLRECGLAAA